MGTLTWSFVVGAVTLVMTYVLIRIYKYLKTVLYIKKCLSKFPGPKPHWFFGNILQIDDFSDFMFRMHDQYIEQAGEKVYIFWIFWFQPVVILSHPDTIKLVMKTNAPKTLVGPGYPFLVPWLGHSLLIANGPKWERNRRLLTPAFHFNILSGYFKIYNEVADVLLKKLENGSKDGKYMDIFKPASMATLDTLLQCSLGYKGDVQLVGESHPYVTAVNRLGALISLRSLSLHHYPECLYRWTADGKEFFKLTDYVHEFSEKIIAARRKELNENKEVKNKRLLDFLDILLTAKDDNGMGLTDYEIRNEVDTFLFAGHDTTASVLSWSLYRLAKHKDIQEKIYKEVKEAIGMRKCIESADITNLKYLTCFLKEVMRLHTPVPIVNRTTDETIVVDGLEIPSGTMVDLCIYNVHNNPDVWENPKEFRPERFEGDKHHEMDPYSFTPFSAGPRNCIGLNFAQNEEKALVARIVERFEISFDEKHEVKPLMEVVMRTKTGIMLNFKVRE